MLLEQWLRLNFRNEHLIASLPRKCSSLFASGFINRSPIEASKSAQDHPGSCRAFNAFRSGSIVNNAPVSLKIVDEGMSSGQFHQITDPVWNPILRTAFGVSIFPPHRGRSMPQKPSFALQDNALLRNRPQAVLQKSACRPAEQTNPEGIVVFSQSTSLHHSGAMAM